MSECRCGLIGTGIGASLSPAPHEAEARSQGLDLSYPLFDVDGGLDKLLDQAERDGFAGLNITHPVKQQVIEFLGRLSPQTRAIGAVNTVVLRDGERHGHNTDAYGFTEAFRAALPGARTRHVVQLGAGGAGAACAYAQLSMGVEVYMPVETELLRAARAAGVRAVGGTAMCAYQAAAAFQHFTGRTPDTARMLRHLDVFLA